MTYAAELAATCPRPLFLAIAGIRRHKMLRRNLSANGTKQTYRDICRLSAFGGKADMMCSF